jgi:hypothetical protein
VLTPLDACCFAAAYTPSPQFLQVLPLVVGGIQDVQMLCGLLQVSSTVRSALQQARASGVADSRSMPVIGTVHTFSRFCSWLPQHTGLVKDLTILPAVGEDCEVMAHMLQITLFSACPDPCLLPLLLSIPRHRSSWRSCPWSWRV